MGNMRKLVLTLENDIDCECPSDWDDNWKLYSFNRRHNSYGEPDGMRREDSWDYNDRLSIGFQSKLRAGTAFWLDYYEHGLCKWFIGPGIQDKDHKDSEIPRCGGVLVWEWPVDHLGPKSYQDREKDAAQFCETYTDWANGNCYWFSLETRDGDDVDSCGGFYGEDDVISAIKDALKPGDLIVRLGGEAKWVAEYADLPIDLKQDFDGEYDT